MSKVRATAGPAFGIVRYTWPDPAATRWPAVQLALLGGVGGGVAGACVDVGNGVTFGSPLTTRTHPGSMTFGLVSSEGWRSAFQAWSCRLVVPNARAIEDSESPGPTV